MNTNDGNSYTARAARRAILAFSLAAGAALSTGVASAKPKVRQEIVISSEDGDVRTQRYVITSDGHRYDVSVDGDVVHATVDGEELEGARIERRSGDGGDVLVILSDDGKKLHELFVPKTPGVVQVGAQSDSTRGPRWVGRVGADQASERETVERLIAREMEAAQDRPRIGVLLFADAPMVIVEQVQEGTPAERAGVQRYDIIREIDGEGVSSFDELVKVMKDLDPGDEVELIIERGGKEIELELTLDTFGGKDGGASSQSRGFTFSIPSAPSAPTPPITSHKGGAMSMFFGAPPGYDSWDSYGAKLREAAMARIAEAMSAEGVDLSDELEEQISEAIEALQEGLMFDRSFSSGFGQGFSFGGDSDGEKIWWMPRGMGDVRGNIEVYKKQMDELGGQIEDQIEDQLSHRMEQLEGHIERLAEQLETVAERMERDRRRRDRDD